MITAIVLISICFLLGYVTSRNIFAPAVLTSGIWLICIMLYQFLGKDLYPITSKFYVGVAIWVVCYSFSAMFVQSLKTKSWNGKKVPSLFIRKIYFYVSIATFPILLYRAYRVTQLGFTTNWLFDLRAASVGIIPSVDPADMSPFFVVIWLVAYLIEVYFYRPEYKHRVIILGLLYLFFAFVTVSKAAFLTLFISTIFILYLKKKVKLRHLLLGLIILFLFMETIQGYRNRGKESSVDRHNFVSTYVLSNMPAFETIQPKSSNYFGENTFRIFYAIKYRLGFSNQEPLDPILPFIRVPILTNTYTALYPTYKDFGYWGIGIYATILGAILGYIFKKTQSHNPLFIIIYACLLTAIVIQFSNEFFLSFFALQIKYVIVALIPFMFYVKKTNILLKRQ